ncbi:isoflavone reductase [Histoplasma capsulatum]|uniref:Isoflavone reductase n=1 Tax=Ajellomyces capsulatus TaxID=5037 RepID=A0A8A1MPR7_AJECA|nr:predicted protein [Histoplasma mississippiense (nom. inval.)]EDN11347.1 predicted protein [Histoplasma mississippiense (nom. inval.)]QSS66744.1 isoflavone reductase [Histoplasma capsulatum]
MSDISKVTIIGAAGHLGQHILTALLGERKLITQILTRIDSTSSFPDDIPVVRADFSSVNSLKDALRRQHAIISVVGIQGVSDQINVIDAAVAVGVRRFIPSEFGNHPESEHKRLPEMRMTQPAKIAVMKHLAEKVVETAGRFSWTAIAVGNFFDWSIKRFPAFGFDLANKEARIYDSGNEHITGVLIDSVGQAVVGTFLNPVETANKFLRIRSLETTQNEILAAFEQLTESKWAVERISTQELYRIGREKMAMGKAGWILDILCTQIFADGGGRSVVATWEDSDNTLVGVQEVELQDVIRGIVAESRDM